MYAAAAARLAIVLEKYAPARAKAYRESAILATAWAERNTAAPDIYGFNALQLAESANLAAVWMYRMTGDAKWHEEFKRTFREIHGTGSVRLDRTRYATGPWGIAVYAMMPADKADAEIQARCKEAFVKAADDKVAKLNRWVFPIDFNPPDYDQRLGDPWSLMIAHRLTQDPKYVLAISRIAQYAMGANPNNASHTSGMGARQVTVFNLDAYYNGVALPEGITIYGPYYRHSWNAKELESALGGIYPEWKHWPWAESVFNLRYAPMTEYTVGGNMANQLLMRGYLALQFAAKAN